MYNNTQHPEPNTSIPSNQPLPLDAIYLDPEAAKRSLTQINNLQKPPTISGLLMGPDEGQGFLGTTTGNIYLEEMNVERDFEVGAFEGVVIFKFSANVGRTSPYAPVSLDAQGKIDAGIDPRAARYAFVYPMENLGEFLASNEGSNLSQTQRDFLTIGGFIYLDNNDRIVQAKAISTLPTGQVLHFGKARLSDELPPSLQAHIDTAFQRFNNVDENFISGMSTVTEPDMRNRGARHFMYIPQNTGRGQGTAEFWGKYPYGLYAYIFENTNLNCFLPIFASSEHSISNEQMRITYNDRNGQVQTIEKASIAFMDNHDVHGRIPGCVCCNVKQPSEVLLKADGKTPASSHISLCEECAPALAQSICPITREPFVHRKKIREDLANITAINHNLFDTISLEHSNDQQALDHINQGISTYPLVSQFQPYESGYRCYVYPNPILAAENQINPIAKRFFENGGYLVYHNDQAVRAEITAPAPSSDAPRTITNRTITDRTEISRVINELQNSLFSPLLGRLAPLTTINPINLSSSSQLERAAFHSLSPLAKEILEQGAVLQRAGNPEIRLNEPVRLNGSTDLNLAVYEEVKKITSLTDTLRNLIENKRHLPQVTFKKLKENGITHYLEMDKNSSFLRGTPYEGKAGFLYFSLNSVYFKEQITPEKILEKAKIERSGDNYLVSFTTLKDAQTFSQIIGSYPYSVKDASNGFMTPVSSNGAHGITLSAEAVKRLSDKNLTLFPSPTHSATVPALHRPAGGYPRSSTQYFTDRVRQIFNPGGR